MVRTKEQAKEELTVFLDDEDNFSAFSDLLPNVYSVQDFFASHKWSDIWLNGRVKKWFNKSSNELIIWIGPLAIQLVIKEDGCFVSLNSDTTEEQIDYEVTVHLLLDIAIEEYSKLSFSQNTYYNSLNIPWVYRQSFVPQSYLASLSSDYASGLKYINENNRRFLIENFEKLNNMSLTGLQLTLSMYSSYCRIAREAAFDHKQDVNLTDTEFYQRFADGRHGGLLDISPDCPNAFMNWYDSNLHAGSHPFEIVFRKTLTEAFHLIPVKDEKKNFRLVLR